MSALGISKGADNRPPKPRSIPGSAECVCLTFQRRAFRICLALAYLIPPTLWALQRKAGHERQPMAGTIVRSREYVVHRGVHEIEEFIGNVYYRQGSREMNADWAQFDRDQGQWNVRGHITAKGRLEDGSAVEAHGELAQHSTLRKIGWLTGKDAGSTITYRYFAAPSTASAASQTPIERDHGSARRMAWNDTSSEVRLEGSVHMLGEDGELWSDEARWNRDKKQIHFHGNVHLIRPDGTSWSQDAEYHTPDRHAVFAGRRPVLTRQDPKSNMAIQGDIIMADQNPERLDADGQVKGWLWFVQEKKDLKSHPHEQRKPS